MYIMRLDDACEYMDINRWARIENMLLKYNISPIVGIIPKVEDPAFISKYKFDIKFWSKARLWQKHGWCIAMHGYNHLFLTCKGGVNPVNNYSEFAGVDLEMQREKIRKGIKKFTIEQLTPKVFFAPAHTFDKNTLRAIKDESNIRWINDTIANDIYFADDFNFIPQQSGKVRNLPFKVVTFCYHPNDMDESEFVHLEKFLKLNSNKFISFSQLDFTRRRFSIYDKFLETLYFRLRELRRT